jgi:hypothetical protein
MNLPPALLACATCALDQGTNVAQAATTSVVFMVGLVGSVLSVFLYAIIKFAIKQRRFAQTNP